MYKIWKYILSITDTQVIDIPEDSKILKVGVQEGTNITMWCMVNPDAPKISRVIKIYGTGQDVKTTYPEDAYVGSVQLDGYVWHIFDEGEYKEEKNGASQD